ncbi:hypothetical protein [Pseudomonas sp. ACN5]|nr:hypothetical protein [Pseudomonas sp. ACN5]
MSTFLINLATAPAEESDHFANMSRPEIIVTEKWARQLEGLSKKGEKSQY